MLDIVKPLFLCSQNDMVYWHKIRVRFALCPTCLDCVGLFSFICVLKSCIGAMWSSPINLFCSLPVAFVFSLCVTCE